MNRSLLQGLGLAVTLGMFSASATMITGTVDTTGTAGVSATAIDFYSGPPGCNTGPNPGNTTPPANDCFLTGIGTGSFATASGTNGGILDLAPPIVGAKNVVSFMTFANGVTFDLTNIPLAGTPTCSSVDPTQGGVSCVPGASGFRLTNGPGTGPNGTGTATSVGIQFTVGLNGYTGTSASGFTPYIGIFTTQVAGQNAQDVLNTLAAGGGTGIFVHSYSGSFSPAAAIPEPASLLLMGAGLLGFSVIGRRFSRR
ncbi:MAG: hypothetical protein JWO80_777 [Bryobacterales bacterium]|nr:hypothetical protein [Bryobacterales bacterium]